MVLKNIHLRILFILGIVSTSGSAAEPTLVCLGRDRMLTRDVGGELAEVSFAQASSLLGGDAWKSIRAKFEPAAASEEFKGRDLAAVLRTSCSGGALTIQPDVWIIVEPDTTHDAPTKVLVRFIYDNGIYSTTFSHEGGKWKKAPGDIPLRNALGKDEKQAKGELLAKTPPEEWPDFWDAFVSERIALGALPISRLISTASTKRLWLHIVTVRSPNDLPNPAYRPIIPQAAAKQAHETKLTPVLFTAVLFVAITGGILLRPLIDKMARARRRQNDFSQGFRPPVATSRPTKANAERPVDPPGIDPAPPVVNTDGLANLAAQLGRQIEADRKFFDANSALVQDASRQMDAATRMLSDTSVQILRDNQPLFNSVATTLNNANATIESATRELKTTAGSLKKETASLPALSTQFETATAGIASSADKLTATNERVLTLLSQLQEDSARVAIAQKDADNSKAAEKSARELADRLTKETALLREKLESDPLSAASPVLAKLEDELKKALRNFSGSTRDRTGLSSPLLALLTSHCLYLLTVAVRNNDALLQSAMRSNLSRITDLGSGLNLLGFQQARETLQNAGWFTGRLGQQFESTDSDLKDASWFQTALKYIQDRENLSLGPFYVGLDTRGRVQYVN